MMQINQLFLPTKCVRCNCIFDLSKDVHLNEEMMQEFIITMKTLGAKRGMLCTECRH